MCCKHITGVQTIPSPPAPAPALFQAAQGWGSRIPRLVSRYKLPCPLPRCGIKISFSTCAMTWKRLGSSCTNTNVLGTARDTAHACYSRRGQARSKRNQRHWLAVRDAEDETDVCLLLSLPHELFHITKGKGQTWPCERPQITQHLITFSLYTTP